MEGGRGGDGGAESGDSAGDDPLWPGDAVLPHIDKQVSLCLQDGPELIVLPIGSFQR